jgi:alkanesulfonate monooxygenase SsuD/methylene tetrahydromethanopterin reductase-like flavin-dependent oxidoreductase (luciferase family)
VGTGSSRAGAEGSKYSSALPPARALYPSERPGLASPGTIRFHHRRLYGERGLARDLCHYAVGSLAEACTVIRRLWTNAEPFDFNGAYVQLAGAFCNPKPVQRPHPPILIGGRSASVLRVVAEHADLWNIPGGDIDDVVRRSALLDRYCAEIGRDPASVTRSIHLPISYNQSGATRDAIGKAIDAGFQHIILGLPAPYPTGVARCVVTSSSPDRLRLPAVEGISASRFRDGCRATRVRAIATRSSVCRVVSGGDGRPIAEP